MRAVDRWAIEERGDPVARADGGRRRARLAEVALERSARPGPVADRLRQGQQRRRRARRRAPPRRDRASRSSVLLLWPADELSAPTRPRTSSGSRARCARSRPARLEAALGRLRRRRRRDLRHRLRGRAARAGRRRDRGDQRLRRPGRRRRHRLRRRRLDRRGRGRRGRRRRHRQLSTPRSSATGSRPASGTPGELRVAPIGIPPGAPAGAGGGLIGTAVLELLPRRGAGLDQVQLRRGADRRRLARAHRRGLHGREAAIRAGAGYATVAVPADLEPIFEAKLTEVMSLGCPSDGRRPRRRRRGARSSLRAERAAARRPRPGARPRRAGRRSWSASCAPRIEAPLVIDADGLNATPGRLELLAERRAPTVLTPHAGELGAAARAATRRRSAPIGSPARREAATRSGAVVVLKGDDTIVVPRRRPRRDQRRSTAPALATAGTGDVLSGHDRGAARARARAASRRACAAVYAHARAGRVAGDRGSGRRIGDRHRRDRGAPGWARRAET